MGENGEKSGYFFCVVCRSTARKLCKKKTALRITQGCLKSNHPFPTGNVLPKGYSSSILRRVIVIQWFKYAFEYMIHPFFDPLFHPTRPLLATFTAVLLLFSGRPDIPVGRRYTRFRSMPAVVRLIRHILSGCVVLCPVHPILSGRRLHR